MEGKVWSTNVIAGSKEGENKSIRKNLHRGKEKTAVLILKRPIQLILHEPTIQRCYSSNRK